MERDKEFNNILDECLERLLVNGETIEQCLLSYHEYAAELEPLLHTVIATKEALAVEPRPEFKSKARYQFRLALQEVEPKRRLPILGWQPRWAIAMAVVLVLLLGGGGTVVAAGNSMPDGVLYPVKLAAEQVQLKLTPSDMGKAELYAKLADRRVAEIVYMVNKGKPEQVRPTAERLKNHLALIVSLSSAEGGETRVMLAPAAEEAVKEAGKGVSAQASKRAKLKTLLRGYAVNHPAALRAVLNKAPESAKPALLQVITELVDNYEKALEALD